MICITDFHHSKRFFVLIALSEIATLAGVGRRITRSAFYYCAFVTTTHEDDNQDSTNDLYHLARHILWAHGAVRLLGAQKSSFPFNINAAPHHQPHKKRTTHLLLSSPFTPHDPLCFAAYLRPCFLYNRWPAARREEEDGWFSFS